MFVGVNTCVRATESVCLFAWICFKRVCVWMVRANDEEQLISLMPMCKLSKASSHPSSQALASPLAPFLANKAPVPPGRLQSRTSLQPRADPFSFLPTIATSNVDERESLPFTD